MPHVRNQCEKILRLRILLLLSIVVGLMIVYPVARSATARQMLTCPQLSAWYNLMPRVVSPGKPDTTPTFYVAGKCTFPTPGFSVELKTHTPPSPDPKILLLDAVVHAPSNPVPGGTTDVNVRYDSRPTSSMY